MECISLCAWHFLFLYFVSHCIEPSLHVLDFFLETLIFYGDFNLYNACYSSPDGPASAVIASVVLGCGYLVELLVVIIIVIVVIWRKRRPRPLLNGGEGQPLNNRPPNQP